LNDHLQHIACGDTFAALMCHLVLIYWSLEDFNEEQFMKIHQSLLLR